MKEMRRLFIIYPLFLFSFTVAAQPQIGLRFNNMFSSDPIFNVSYGIGAYCMVKIKRSDFQPFVFLDRNYFKHQSIENDLTVESIQKLWGAGALYKFGDLWDEKINFNILSTIGYSKTESHLTGYYANWSDHRKYSHLVFDLGINIQMAKLLKTPFNIDIFITPEYWVFQNASEPPKQGYNFDPGRNALWWKLGAGISYTYKYP